MCKRKLTVGFAFLCLLFLLLAPSATGGQAGGAEPSEEESLVTLFEAVDKYKEQGHLNDAKELLEAKLTANPPIEKDNVDRRIELAKKLDEVKAAITAKDQQRLRGLVKQLNETQDETEKETLRKLLQAALQKDVVKQTVGFAAEIERALKASDTSPPALLPGFLRKAISTIREASAKAAQILVEVVIYFFFLVGGLLLLRSFRNKFLSRRGVGLVLEDETKPDNEREEANRKLNMLMAHEIRAIEGGGTPGIEAAGLSDQAGTESSIGKVAEFKDLVDDTAVKVGPVTFSPQQIFTFLGRLLSPQHKYLLAGSLTQAQGVTSLSVTERSPNGTPVKDHRYHASAAGCTDEQREQVVRDVAIQFAAQNAVSVVTQDWKSLRAYLEADAILERKCVGEDRNKDLEEALTTLQRSLRHDPSNWMARHNAGIVLRRLGRHKDAADQFDYLRRMLSSPGIRNHKHYQTFLARQPDFEWMVSYNLALSWVATGRWRDNERALDTINELLKKARAGEGASALQRFSSKLSRPPVDDTDDLQRYTASQLRHIALALSARAVASTMRLELLRRQVRRGEKLQQEVEKQMKSDLDQVDDDESWIWQMIKKGNVQEVGDWQAYTRAHSAAQSARGRAHYLMEDYKGALTYLRWAVNIHAPEAFAEPFVHMAAVILKLKSEYAVDWASQADAYLNKALEINPTHSKAHHLRGQVFADPSEGRYAEAKKEFDAAGDYWASLAEHACLLWEQDQDYESALKLLRRSLSIERLADERAALFCEVVSKRADANERLLKEGIEWADLLNSKGLTTTLQKRGADLGDILEDRLKKLQKAGGKPVPGSSADPKGSATK